MCLIVLDWRRDTRQLVVASNRDEYYERPSQPAHFWNGVYAGRDSRLGGTWLACSTAGATVSPPRLAAVTNFFSHMSRLGPNQPRFPKSRGDLVVNFVRQHSGSVASGLEFCRQLQADHDQYGGFCAFLMDGNSLYYCTNRKPTATPASEEKNPTNTPTYEFEFRELSSGTYGLSNHLLDTPWPKLQNAKERLQRGIQQYYNETTATSSCDNDDDDLATQQHQRLAKDLIEQVMENPDREEDRSLLATTLTPEEEYVRSAIFVKGPIFGTRTTTIMTCRKGGGFHVTEKNHVTPYVATPSLSYQHVKLLPK
jgi:uncharacterized protein with NRDE domain